MKLKSNDIIYRCNINNGFGSWHKYWDSDCTDEDIEKPTWELQSYIVRTIKRKYKDGKKYVYVVAINEFTYKNKIFEKNISDCYRYSWPLEWTPEPYARTKAAAISKAISIFKKEGYNKEAHKNLMTSLKSAYTRFRNNEKKK